MAYHLPPSNTPFASGPAQFTAGPLATSSAPALRESTGSNNTYVMSRSPLKNGRKRNHEPYMPKIITTVGQRPACLVNASVTYVGNDQIYAFGGFDQYTDEGWSLRPFFADTRLTISQSTITCSSST